jgi:putative intracellular protease/amidase
MRIVIPIFDRFTALDAVGPYEVLGRMPGAEVSFAALERGPVRTDTRALAITADVSFGEVEGCDVLVVPGGPGVQALCAEERTIGWLRAIHETTQWTTSVCTGSLLLAAAGLLEGVPATTHWGAVEELEALGARYTPERVVAAGKMMTAAGVSAGIDMALTLAAEIAGEEVAEAIQLGIEYDPQPPFDRGSVEKARPEVVAGLRALRESRG